MIPLTITDVRAIPGDSAFLIDDGETAVLYDTGFGFTGYSVAEKIRRILGERPLDYILLTHSHYDHALGSAYIRKVYPNVQVVAGAYAHKIFSKPTARAVMGDLDRKAAASLCVTDYEDLTGELRADVAVADGDVIECGRMKFTAVELPGHTKCSVGYYLAENRLLLGAETLGVYFGEGFYLPSFLVGYGMTMASIEKAMMLDIDQLLIPHFGPVSGEEARNYLAGGQRSARESADLILAQLAQGKTDEEILAYLTEVLYTDRVRPSYPEAAFRMNTEIMIRLIRNERFDRGEIEYGI